MLACIFYKDVFECHEQNDRSMMPFIWILYYMIRINWFRCILRLKSSIIFCYVRPLHLHWINTKMNHSILLQRHVVIICYSSLEGFEPPTFRLTADCSNHWATETTNTKKKCAEQGSNPRPQRNIGLRYAFLPLGHPREITFLFFIFMEEWPLNTILTFHIQTDSLSPFPFPNRTELVHLQPTL